VELFVVQVEEKVVESGVKYSLRTICSCLAWSTRAEAAREKRESDDEDVPVSDLSGSQGTRMTRLNNV